MQVYQRSGNGGPFAAADNTDSEMLIAGNFTANESVSNTAAEGGANVRVELMRQAETGKWPQIRTQAAFVGALGEMSHNVGSGCRAAAQDTNAVRFLFETGNIASGNWAVYGYV
jgi:hypothetical protein